MGYHVTILRTKNGKQESISVAEVQKALTSLSKFKLRSASAPWKDCYEISFPASKGEDHVLLWKKGEIWTKNPDDEALQGMIDLSEKLNARVRGDEFETYRTPEESYEHPDDLAAIKDSQQLTEKLIRTSKRKQWLLNVIIFGSFILLGLLVSYFSK